MSKLAEMIRSAGRPDSGPLGFGLGGVRRAAAASLLCLVRLDKDQAKKAGGTAEADAVILSGVEPGKLADVIKKLKDAPVGLRLEGAERSDVAAAREAGADFVVVDERSSGESLIEERIGLVLRLGAEVSDTELRALAGLPLEALEIGAAAEPFSVRRLVELRRLALLSQTPLLVDVEPGIKASRLEALRGAGVAGVVLDGKSADKLEALRKAVLSLPVRGRRREERAEALLPSLAGVNAGEDEDDEFDDE
jgi:hypothetical protein